LPTIVKHSALGGAFGRRGSVIYLRCELTS
jgi:hypothetical protein